MSKAQADTDSILPITKDFITSSSSISSASTASTRTSNRSQEILDKASGRTMVLQEFINSEETYVNLLEEFDDIYIQSACAPLTFHTGGKLSRQVTFDTALTLDERRTMFNGLQEILSLHRTLVLPKLFAATQVLLTQGDDHDGLRSTHTAFEVCQVICKFADWFKMYSAYSVTCDNATARLTQWTNGINMVRQDKNRVQAYLTKCKVNKNHSQINMTGYLLLPVQRLTRYKMLVSISPLLRIKLIPFDSLNNSKSTPPPLQVEPGTTSARLYPASLPSSFMSMIINAISTLAPACVTGQTKFRL